MTFLIVYYKRNANGKYEYTTTNQPKKKRKTLNDLLHNRYKQ